MGQSLKGRTALVTGSTSGIGQGIAELYAAEGANVVLNGFGDSGAIEELRRKLSRHGVRIGYDGANMSKASEIEAMMTRIGEIDILVNNAGIQHVRPLPEFEPETFALMLRIMVEAPFLLIRAVLPGMYERGFGRIVNIASTAGLKGYPYVSAYCAAKHALDRKSVV